MTSHATGPVMFRRGFGPRRWLFVFMVGVGALAATGTAAAQGTGAPRPKGRLEVTFLLGVVRPSVVVAEPGGLRSPPTLRETEQSYRALTREVAARVLWTRRLSTMIGVGWSGEASRSFSFSRPLSLPEPFTHYEAERAVFYRSRFLSAMQAWDIGPRTPFVPFVEAGVEFRSVVNRQDSVDVGYLDPTSRSSSSSERSGIQTAGLVGAGLRILVGRHSVVSADGALFATHSATQLGAFSGRWRVGAGVRF